MPNPGIPRVVHIQLEVKQIVFDTLFTSNKRRNEYCSIRSVVHIYRKVKQICSIWRVVHIQLEVKQIVFDALSTSTVARIETNSIWLVEYIQLEVKQLKLLEKIEIFV